jgi:hypothetical protein
VPQRQSLGRRRGQHTAVFNERSTAGTFRPPRLPRMKVSPAHLAAYTDLKPGLLSTARSTTCGLRGRHSRSLPSLRTAPHGLCGKGTRCPFGSSSDACLDSRRSPPIPRRFGSVASEHTGRRSPCAPPRSDVRSCGRYSTRVVGERRARTGAAIWCARPLPTSH